MWLANRKRASVVLDFQRWISAGISTEEVQSTTMGSTVIACQRHQWLSGIFGLLIRARCSNSWPYVVVFVDSEGLYYHSEAFDVRNLSMCLIYHAFTSW